MKADVENLLFVVGASLALCLMLTPVGQMVGLIGFFGLAAWAFGHLLFGMKR